MHNTFKQAVKTKSTHVASSAHENWKTAKKACRLEVRKQRHQEAIARDRTHSSSQQAVFKTIKSSKLGSASAVPFLTVKEKKYEGYRVPDGIYDSISSIKQQDTFSLLAIPNFEIWSQDYTYILQLCKNKHDIPMISLADSNKILERMKPSVNYFCSITPHALQKCWE